MKTIDSYVIRGLAAENLELLLQRIEALHLNLNLLINGVPQSASITTDSNISKIKEKLLRYMDVNDVIIISVELTTDFFVRIKYSYKKDEKEIKGSDTFSLKEAEDCGIEIKYI